MLKTVAAIALALILPLPAAARAEEVKAAYGIAMHGQPKYPAGFTHLDYVNPGAPKGGTLRLAQYGGFDSLNPYILKGIAAPGLGLVYQTLMSGTLDEPFSEYGLLAESIETPKDRSWAIFTLRPEARWADGKPVTADDVVWSFNTLTTKGHPQYRVYYANVKSVEALDAHRVKFTFSGADNRELPLIAGQMPVLPRHAWEGKDFSATTTDMPLGSGPYRVKSFDSGKRITFEHVKNWWAKDVPVVKGMYNFDTVIYDSFRDDTVLLQALFSGNYDLREENIAKSWETEYNQPPVVDGRIRKEEIKNSMPVGMQAFAFNLRRPLFQDARVRQALGLAFDFDWSNKQFAFGKYKRTESYFANSDLAATGLPQGRELKILEPFKGQVPDEVFTTEFHTPKTSGSGQDMRANLTQAKKLLEEAGWKLGPDGVLVKDGQRFSFEFLLYTPVFTRWIGPMVGNLKKLGVVANIRIVDPAQYQKRQDDFDFDMLVTTFGESLSPGNEQRDFWTSPKADIKGSRNILGVKNPVIDKLVEMVIAAPDREELVARTHALDRVLLWNYYVIPNWHIDYFRVAYWNKFGKPAVTPKYGLGALETWWYDAEKAGKLETKQPVAK